MARHLSKSFDTPPEWLAHVPIPGITFQCGDHFGATFFGVEGPHEELAFHRRYTNALALPMTWFEAAANVALMFPGGIETVDGPWARKHYLEHELLR